jgi:hypothetical protein
VLCLQHGGQFDHRLELPQECCQPLEQLVDGKRRSGRKRIDERAMSSSCECVIPKPTGSGVLGRPSSNPAPPCWSGPPGLEGEIEQRKIVCAGCVQVLVMLLLLPLELVLELFNACGNVGILV